MNTVQWIWQITKWHVAPQNTQVSFVRHARHQKTKGKCSYTSHKSQKRYTTAGCQDCCKHVSQMPRLHCRQCSFCTWKHEGNFRSHQKWKLDRAPTTESRQLKGGGGGGGGTSKTLSLISAVSFQSKETKTTNKKHLSGSIFCMVQLLCRQNPPKTNKTKQKTVTRRKKKFPSMLDLSIFDCVTCFCLCLGGLFTMYSETLV